MQHNIVLLTHDYQFLSILSNKKAIKLMVKQRVEVVKNSDKQLRTGFYLPKVVKLISEIKGGYSRFTKKVAYAKHTVFVRDNFTCQYCGKELTQKTCTIDHILPVSKGGKSEYSNCITSCKTCNSWKGNKLLSQTSMRLLSKPTHPTFSQVMGFKMKTLGIDLNDIW